MGRVRWGLLSRILEKFLGNGGTGRRRDEVGSGV